MVCTGAPQVIQKGPALETSFKEEATGIRRNLPYLNTASSSSSLCLLLKTGRDMSFKESHVILGAAKNDMADRGREMSIFPILVGWNGLLKDSR